jgi:hypothetical protein
MIMNIILALCKKHAFIMYVYDITIYGLTFDSIYCQKQKSYSYSSKNCYKIQGVKYTLNISDIAHETRSLRQKLWIGIPGCICCSNWLWSLILALYGYRMMSSSSDNAVHCWISEDLHDDQYCVSRNQRNRPSTYRFCLLGGPGVGRRVAVHVDDYKFPLHWVSGSSRIGFIATLSIPIPRVMGTIESWGSFVLALAA